MTAGARTVRVLVQDAWDEVTLTVAPATPVAEVKLAALAASGRGAESATYAVKFRGAGIDEAATLEALGVPENGALIVLPRRRRPVR